MMIALPGCLGCLQCLLFLCLCYFELVAVAVVACCLCVLFICCCLIVFGSLLVILLIDCVVVDWFAILITWVSWVLCNRCAWVDSFVVGC